MGYIFDAMNRQQPQRGKAAPDKPAESRKHDEPPAPATPEPAKPTTVDDGKAPAAPAPVVDPIAKVEPATSLRLADVMSAPEGACADVTPPRAADIRDNPAAYAQTDVAAIDDRLVALTDRVSVIAEEYRGIRTSLLARWDQRRHLVHLITSATPQEGKTITSLNLGLSLAELHNRRTIVVECDLRLPQFARLLNLPDSPGLIGCIEGGAELDGVIHGVGDNGLHVIPAGGRANERAVQLLSSGRMSDLLAELRRRYDHVIIDTPPVVDLADAGILGTLSDDVLLIVRMHTTPRGLVEQAVRTLTSYNAPVTHMIATNQTDVGSSYYRSYYGGYRYAYGYRSASRQGKARAA